jgi:hypothetical protein
MELKLGGAPGPLERIGPPVSAAGGFSVPTGTSWLLLRC